MEQPHNPPFDRIIRAGRIVCPRSGIDGPGQIAIRGNQIAAVEPSETRTIAPSPETSVDEFADGILLPGLIDLHAHPANSESVFGVRPDERVSPHGTTTVLSQGDAGASTMDRYVERTIRSAKSRVLLAINLSRVGESTVAGCFEDLDNADINACISAIERYREFIPAVAVNVSHWACGPTDPREVMRRGLEVAERTGLPLLFGMRRPEDWPLEEQLERLRPGDIVTYCFRSYPHCIVDESRTLPCIVAARHRGILFDVGHGTEAFCFDVARAAIADGFLPDTISTDLQRFHVEREMPHDLPRVMSELHAAGMPEDEVFAAVTDRPASILKLDDVGQLRAGATADITVLKVSDNAPFSERNARSATPFWEATFVVKDGRVIAPAGSMGGPEGS